MFHYDQAFQGDDPNPKLYFSGYVNTFLKLKYESSGYPPQCETEEEKQSYVDEIQKRDNIRLDPDNIKPNSSMKTIAKLFLNSLYG